jgi:predicted NBD/HSP70 family sugar kinase
MTEESLLVGVDFTTDTLRLLLANLDGDPVLRERWPLPALADEDAWSWEIGGRIATAFAKDGNRRSALGIAIAAPGPVEPTAGRLLRSVDGQETWDGLAIVDAIRRHIDAPAVAEHRTLAALAGEAWQGAARGYDDVLYISLRGVPASAIMVRGSVLRGAHHEAGALPAVPQLDPEERLADRDLETVAGLLADAVAFADPELVVVDAAPRHAEPLLPLLQRVVDEVAAGSRVVSADLAEDAAVIGAVRLASTVAHEANRELQR